MLVGKHEHVQARWLASLAGRTAVDLDLRPDQPDTGSGRSTRHTQRACSEARWVHRKKAFWQVEEADWESRSSARFRRFAWTSGRACAWNSDENARARLWKDCHLYSVSDFYNPRQPSLRALRKLYAVWLSSICLVVPVCLYLWSWLHLNGPFSAREVGRLSRSSQDDERPANGMPEKTAENAGTSVHVRTTHATRSSTAQRGRIETVSDELQVHWEQLLETEQFHEQAHKLAWIRQRIERYVWRVSFGKGVILIKKTKKGKNCYNPRVCTFSRLQQNVCQVIKKNFFASIFFFASIYFTRMAR